MGNGVSDAGTGRRHGHGLPYAAGSADNEGSQIRTVDLGPSLLIWAPSAGDHPLL